MLDHPDVARYDLRSLQKVSASSLLKKMSIEYRERWRALTGGTLTEPAYGMTETQTFDTFTLGLQDGDMDLKAQPTFVGLPMPGTEILIRDFDSGAPLALGQEGEITIRSPSVTKGYWQTGGIDGDRSSAAGCAPATSARSMSAASCGISAGARRC